MSKKAITSCQGCVFSQNSGNTQVGCAAGQLENYDHIPAYNELGEFFLVQDICMYQRYKSWAGDESDIKVLLDRANKEMSISYNVFIYGAGYDMGLINNTLRSLRAQQNKPAKLVLGIYRATEADVEGYKNILDGFDKWQLENLIEEEHPAQFYFRSIFHHTNKWFLVIKAGETIPAGWIDDCNHKLLNTSKHHKFYIENTAVFAPTSLFDDTIEEIKNISCEE